MRPGRRKKLPCLPETEIQAGGDVLRGGSHQGFERAGFGHPSVAAGIEETQVFPVQGEAQFPAFSGFQIHFLEAFELFHGALHGGLYVGNVQLDHFCTRDAAGIGERGGNRETVFPGGLHRCVGEGEGGVAESVAEGELDGDALAGIPAVADEHAFVIVLLPPFLAFFPDAGILALGLQGTVGQGERHGERKLAGRVHGTGEHIGQGVAAFGAARPALDDGVHLGRPGHGYR